MWAYVTDNTIQEIIRFPKGMVINDVRHPRTIFTAWSWDELNAVGIYTVEAGTVGDDRFEYTSQAVYTFDASNKKVTTAYTKTDRALADSNDVDKDGNAILDDHGNQTVTLGLKSQAKNKARDTANGLLKRFDWIIARKVTADTAIPSALVTYMAAVRTDYANICTAIDDAGDMDAFKLLFADTYKTVDGEQVVDVVARVNRWTDDYDLLQYAR